MSHDYDPALMRRAAAAHAAVRKGADPFDVLTAVVWPSPEFEAMTSVPSIRERFYGCSPCECGGHPDCRRCNP